MLHSDAEFQRELQYYNKYQKPSAEQLAASVSGSTFVDVCDAFEIHQQMYRRDTKEGTADHVSPELECWQLAITIVHPGHPGGHAPISLKGVYSLRRHPMTGALLHVLIHCPSLRDAMLRAFQQEKKDFVRKLLQFSQHFGVHSRNKSGLRDAAACEKAVVDELTRLKLPRGDDYCLSVVKLLSSMSSYVYTYSFSVGDILEHVLIPTSADVLFVYRTAANCRRSDRGALQCEFSGFHLHAVFGGEHLTNVVDFRWNSRCQFWQVKRNERTETHCLLSDSVVQVSNWKILVYARSRQVQFMNDQLKLNLGSQHRMYCDFHNLFLVKQPASCELPCSVQNCTRTAHWRCLARGEWCCNAVCLAHGKDLLGGDDVVIVQCGMSGRTLRPLRSAANAPDPDVEPDVGDVGQNSDAESGDDLDPRVFAPIGINELTVNDDAPPVHSRRDMIPVYDVSNSVPSHFIWNHHYNVMRRSNRHSNIRANAMIEHIVSTSNSACVSLMYPEAQLFPRIFWCEKTGSVLGAIPSFLLNTSSKSVHGVAPMTEHRDVRIRDGDILTSRENGYWHYLFDLKLNTDLNKASSQLVFKRGLEFLLEKTCGQSAAECQLPMDEGEATRRVKELASLLKKGKWTYFVTLTVNDSETPGVREITEAIKRTANGDEEKEVDLTDSFLPFVLRAWERFVRNFFQELIMRNDEILGEVKSLFYRYEFQGVGAKGNKPHVHCGITLVDEPDIVSSSRICCSSLAFHSTIYGTDLENLLRAGIFSSEQEYERWRKVVELVNQHNCANTNFRCMKATSAEGEKICRYHRQPPQPVTADSRGWFEDIAMPYSEDVYELLREMGLAEKAGDVWHVDETLRAGKWHYSSQENEFFLASIPLVSAICRSATNVDMCDRKFQVSYLVKYISGKEEHQLVDVSGTKEMTEVQVRTEEHGHEKITSCQKILEKKEQKSAHHGREICLAEVVWFVLGFPYTYCTAEFVHVPTLPLENRVGVLRKPGRNSRVVAEAASDDNPAVSGRVAAGLPDWRLFTTSQQVHIEDYRRSPYWCDATSSFNVRPAELLMFDDLQVYCECFVVSGTDNCVFDRDSVANQLWFDGLSRRILLRSCSVGKAVEFLTKKSLAGGVSAGVMLTSVFQPILNGEDGFRERFVKVTTAKEMVSVISIIKPWDSTKFVTHLCLSLGHYGTETDLFSEGNMKDAFVKAGLLEVCNEVSRQSILSILKLYVVTDLRFHPISARQFGKYLKAALTTLDDVLVKGVLADYTPCLSEVMLKEQASDILKSKEESRKLTLINALMDDAAIHDLLPHDLQTATLDSPLHWIPLIRQVDGVDANSVAEQTAALMCCIKAVDKFLSPTSCGVKFPCLVGRAGSGKSHVLKLAVAYALIKGLLVELMSWTSERARQLGGNHLHLVFPLEVYSSRINFAHNISSSCLRQLQQDPLKEVMLKRTDVFVFEEIGLLSAEYFAALDNILRAVMGNSLPWGGKLLLSCGDSKQLPPIDGRPIWGCINMCTMMEVFVFTTDVRARDPKLRWLNSECRRELNADECKAVAEVVLTECQFVPDWTHVPDVAVRIVPTKAAELKVVEQFLEGRQTKSYSAIDEVQNGAVWDRAGDRVTKKLNNAVYEYDICQLYLYAVVRMTFNSRHGTVPFSQGQVAIIVQLPDDAVDFAEKRLRLRLAPAGVRRIDAGNIPAEWSEVLVGPRTTPSVVVGRCLQMGRRTQFPVRYYLCSTIHRIQGETVMMLATEMSLKKKEYKLWQREQFAVLISRVHSCQDIIFVGSTSDTRAAVEHIMSKSSKWDNFIDHYMTQMNVAVQSSCAREVQQERHPFLPLYRELPSATCGYVYLLASLKVRGRCYIGETMDLKRCLRQHNTGYGADETRNTECHPWGVFAFVFGFEHEMVENVEELRHEFASEWTGMVSPRQNVEAVYTAGKEIADQWVRRGFSLTIVKCGQTSVLAGVGDNTLPSASAAGESPTPSNASADLFD
jgi:hypothetical protein